MPILGAIAGPIAGAVVGGLLNGGGADSSAGQSTANTEAQARLANTQADIADQQWKRYQQTYQPIEDQYVAESQNLGSVANQNKAATDAAAASAASFAAARKRLNTQPGLQPNSKAALDANADLALGEASTSAATQTSARQAVRDQGRAAMTDAVSLGKGLPAQAGTMLASAGSGLSSAAQTQARLAAMQYDRNSKTAGGLGQMIGGITQTSAFKNWLNGGTVAGNGALMGADQNPQPLGAGFDQYSTTGLLPGQ